MSDGLGMGFLEGRKSVVERICRQASRLCSSRNSERKSVLNLFGCFGSSHLTHTQF